MNVFFGHISRLFCCLHGHGITVWRASGNHYMLRKGVDESNILGHMRKNFANVCANSGSIELWRLIGGYNESI